MDKTYKVKKWGINGEGIAFDRRKPVFIEGAMPGEVVKAEVTSRTPSYEKAELKQVLQPSARRRDAICPHAEECGGCALMHVKYKEQAKMKEQLLKEALKKYAGYTGPVEPILKNPSPLAYRNTLKLPVSMVDGRLRTGMYERGSNDFVALDRCVIHQKELEFARKAIEDVLNEHEVLSYNKKRGYGLRSLVMREFDGKIQVILVTGTEELPEGLAEDLLKVENVVSLWQSVRTDEESGVDVFGDTLLHLGGEKTMHVRVGSCNLQLLPRSFYQLNTKQAEQLYDKVVSFIPDHCGTLVEAYSGIGAISLLAANKADQVIGIELNPDAVQSANANAVENNISNARFICGDAGQELKRLEEETKIDTLVVDPPRSGLDEIMRGAILDSNVDRLIYVSCNPATLAKDLYDLQEEYKIQTIQPVDMFSQTPHVETIVVLDRHTEKD